MKKLNISVWFTFVVFVKVGDLVVFFVLDSIARHIYVIWYIMWFCGDVLYHVLLVYVFYKILKYMIACHYMIACYLYVCMILYYFDIISCNFVTCLFHMIYDYFMLLNSVTLFYVIVFYLIHFTSLNVMWFSIDLDACSLTFKTKWNKFMILLWFFMLFEIIISRAKQIKK